LGFTRTSVVYATPSLTLGTANASGSLASAIRSDSTVLTFDATLPDAITFGQSGSVGTATVASRRDHAHAMASETTSMIGCRIYDNNDQSIANTTNVAISFANEDFDTDTMHDNTTNNSRITCNTAGTYIIYANCAWYDGTTGQRIVTIRLNGSTLIGQSSVAPAISGRTEELCFCMWQLAVDDYVECVMYQNTGSALNMVAAARLSPIFGALKIAS
tara:strand:- start:858 stop:1508 length:651 start_codon:yes stop_codon:yes gene_type:complete